MNSEELSNVKQPELDRLRQELVNAHAELRKRDLELRYLQDDVKRSRDYLEQLAFISNHNLQEPLRKLVMFSNRLLAPGLKIEELRRYAQKINTSSLFMSALMKDLVHFLTLKRDDTTLVSINLSETLEHVITDCAARIDEKKAIVSRNTLPTISGNPTQIRCLFYNLLSNALKFSRERPIITIFSRNAAKDDYCRHPELTGHQYFCIQIHDNGIGFDEKYIQKMFMLFQRIHTRSDLNGTGAGLAICKKIVEDHRGFIFANGTANKGAVFTIFLPVILRGRIELKRCKQEAAWISTG
jgi:light-regulated signal transduction histidine kinase (bacteriophytochrome)